MGHKIYLCATEYPRREETDKLVGINVENSIDGFVKALGRHQILPFFGVYQRMVYSYFFFRKLINSYKLDLVVVTGGSAIIPGSMVSRTIVYVHYPVDIEIINKQYQESRKLKSLYVKPWKYITENLDYFKRTTIITNSNYTKQEIKKAWDVDAIVIYPPCPQYSFPLSDRSKQDNLVCCLGRFTPEKNYDTIIEIAKKMPDITFEFIGGVTRDKLQYFLKLKNSAPRNVNFYPNATIDQKKEVLNKSKVMLHGFIGEHFGIALIEAMSAGLIPVTHNSGAAMVDNLVSEEFRYNNQKEAMSLIEKALFKWNLEEAGKLRKYATKFSSDEFYKNFERFILDWRSKNNL
jgi:glycosyltransferase involved in cell wall biosynthesis